VDGKWQPAAFEKTRGFSQRGTPTETILKYSKVTHGQRKARDPHKGDNGDQRSGLIRETQINYKKKKKSGLATTFHSCGRQESDRSQP